MRGHLRGAHPYRDDARSAFSELLAAIAQLSDELPAECSAVVPQPYDNGRLIAPHVADPHLVAVGVGKPKVLDGGKRLHGRMLDAKEGAPKDPFLVERGY